MMNDVQTAGAAEFKDRKAGLIAFGILEIIAGMICLLLVPLMSFSLLAASSQDAGAAASINAPSVIMAILIYVLLGAGFIWMGIGSILARRWARALWLVSSWILLISGTLGLAFVLLFLPDMYEQMGENGTMPPQMVAIMKYAMIGIMVVFYIIIPGVMILFYGSKHTKATCEQRDGRVRWTDKCPIPVLAISLMAGSWAVFAPCMGFYGWAIPFFGSVLTGFAGAVVVLLGAGLLGYVAWGLYRLSLNAWKCAVILLIAWIASCGLTFSRISLMEYYEKMNMPSQQLEMMKPFVSSLGDLMVPFCVVWGAVALAFLFYIKKYFGSSGSGMPAMGVAPVVKVVLPPPMPSMPVAVAPSSGGLAIASLVLGILALVLGIFVIGGLFGILGLILGGIHLVRGRSHRAYAGWGVGLSLVGLLLALVVPIICMMAFKNMPRATTQQRYEQTVKELADPATPELNRFYALNFAAKESFQKGKTDEARAYAEEQATMLERYKGDWNYGNAVQDINLVLGRIALSEGKLDEAKDRLLKAGDSPGSPQMNSFGPNMSLAKDLLEAGEKQVVIEYFKKCAVFWKMNNGRLDAWTRQVESGIIPEFGANLVY